MRMPLPTTEPPFDCAPLVAAVRQQLGEPLLALLMFGSCLSDRTRQPGSVPDLLAFVSDLGAALAQLGCGPATRWLASVMPPLTLALREAAGSGRGRPLAKLNLIALVAAQQAVRELPDLYLAGRLSKPTAWLWHRDLESRQAVETLREDAATAVADLTLRGLDGEKGPLDLAAVVQLYIGQSYLAEVRPEGQEKWHALHASFPDFYDHRVKALLVARAKKLGLRPIPESPPGALEAQYLALLDQRPARQRQLDQKARAQLLRRSRLRTVARWPKMALVYRGWLPYLLGKLRRVLRQRLSRAPHANDRVP